MKTTLRTRLLLGISATIVVTLSMTQSAMYVLIRRQLVTEFDDALAAKVRALAVLIEQHGEEIEIEFRQHPMQEFARSVRPEYYQVWHEDGHVLARSRQLQQENLAQLAGDRVVPQIRDVLLPDGRHGRAAGIRFHPNMEGDLPKTPKRAQRNANGEIPELHDDDDDALDLDEMDFGSRPLVTLVVARDRQDLEASLAGLTWLLAGSGAGAAAIILGVLAWLVTRNLQPLLALAKQIGEINEQSLDQRFSLDDAPAELDPIVARLNGLMARLETAFNREKTFTADIAHELRTPLAGIRSTLEVCLSRDRDHESYVASLQKCLQISRETDTIISALLSISRIEAGHATLDADIVDLSSVLQRAWRPFASRAPDRGVTVTWDLNERCVLSTDREKLQMVISNLLDNATSYVDDGGEILISTSVDEMSNLHFAVTNTGCLLTTEEVGHTCDRFWRGDCARAATGIHSGLGLALARRIIQFLGGEIDITVNDRRFTASIQLPASCIEYVGEPVDEHPDPVSLIAAIETERPSCVSLSPGRPSRDVDVLNKRTDHLGHEAVSRSLHSGRMDS